MRTRKIKRFNGMEYAMVARVSPSASWFNPVKVPSRKQLLNPWN